jgi:hypothetical protein
MEYIMKIQGGLPFKVQPVCFISLKDKNDKYLAKT